MTDCESIVVLFLLLGSASSSDQHQFAPECPTAAVASPIAKPSTWADDCFARTTGRAPSEERGERASTQRDLDLDGIDEHLEIRGTGQSSKNIFVFKVASDGFYYLGQLDAHPSFDIRRDSNGVIEYSYYHGIGLEDGMEIVLRYLNDEYKVVRRTPLNTSQ